jgi:hypothetical protein
MKSAGLPHSEIPGYVSTQLTEAYRSVATSFIGPRRPGIHPAPLVDCVAPDQGFGPRPAHEAGEEAERQLAAGSWALPGESRGTMTQPPKEHRPEDRPVPAPDPQVACVHMVRMDHMRLHDVDNTYGIGKVHRPVPPNAGRGGGAP